MKRLTLLLVIKLELMVLCSSTLERPSPLAASSNCQKMCGDVNIIYPFGIGASCYLNKFYEIICNTSSHPPKPLLHSFNLEIIDISSNPGLVVKTPLQSVFRSNNPTPSPIIDLRGSPFSISRWYNVLMVKGCGVNVAVKNINGDILTACTSISMYNGSYVEMGSCQATLLSSPIDAYAQLADSIDFYTLDFTFNQPQALFNSQSCTSAVAGLLDLRLVSNLKSFQTVLDWSHESEKPLVKGLLPDSFNCDAFNHCTCNRLKGYIGNPYKVTGCNLVKDCQVCKHGCLFYQTDRYGSGFYYCANKPIFSRDAILGISISGGSVVLLVVVYGLYRLVKKIKDVIQKTKNFRRNGGLLLLQHISSRDNVVQKTKIFTIDELEKATNSFSEDRILGQGGQGTVYKGMLEDGTIVAIKKSVSIVERRTEQFINEIRILSLINHRNVVKLLGCCLETEVPLLVYEFIPNGTLHQHIHEPSEDFHITWRMRLRIASESASALAYLHSSSASPIYHRDIKTENILLDDKYKAKVSDFGISRVTTIEDSHVSTRVHGTVGYFDPEYVQSQQFTDKSDVYSFGVVLIELITGKKAVHQDRLDEWINLANEFMIRMKTSWLRNNVDPLIKGFANEEELLAVANLAKQCLSKSGKQRPTMRTVAVALDRIWSAYVSTPKLQQVMVCNSLNAHATLRTSFHIEAQPLMNSI